MRARSKILHLYIKRTLKSFGLPVQSNNNLRNKRNSSEPVFLIPKEYCYAVYIKSKPLEKNARTTLARLPSSSLGFA